MGTEQVGQHTAPVDIPHDIHREPDFLRQSEIGHIGIPQVYLRRRSGPLTDDEVEAFPEFLQLLRGGAPQVVSVRK